MVDNPYRWRAAIPQLENRNATAGCLLALLFFVPYLAKHGTVSNLFLTFLVLIYVVLVVPLLTGIMPKKKLIAFVRRSFSTIVEPELWIFLWEQIRFLILWIHSIYIQLDGVHLTTMQVVFNIAAEKILCPDQRLCSLYVLLFYSVLAYLQRSLQARPWTQLLNETSAKEFIKLTTAFIIARLGKGVAMSMVLLTLTLQFNDLEPSITFVTLTFLYFSLTQYHDNPVLKSVLTHCLTQLHLQWLDGMEELWAPLLVDSSVIFMASVVAMICMYATNNYIVILITCYINILVPTIIMLKEKWKPLSDEKKSIGRFPLASWKNRESGGLCAVCLDKLRLLSARVTRCGHVFHGACLRLCLRYSSRCPLCKSQL